MSKFLKFIVNLVVLLVIVVALALMVPQFLGVETVMNDNTEIETNLPTGSVAYGRTVNVSDLKEGDRILYSEGAQTYVYEITDMDASGGSYQVQDIYNVQSDDATVKLTKNVSKVVLIVPFIGYAAIALQTTEGLIVVGLGVVFLVILFILSELWRKDKDEDDEEEDSEEDEASDAEEEEEEEVLSRRERKRLKREEKRRRKLEKKGYDEEDEEEETLAPLKFPEEPAAAGESAADTDQVTSDEEPEQLADADEEIFRQVSQPEEAGDATAILPDPDALFEDRDASDDIETEEDQEEPEQVTDATVILPDMEELSQEDSVEADLEEEFLEEPEIPEESEVPEEPEEESLTQILPEIAEPEEIIEEAETEYDNNIEETVSSSQEIQINPDLVPVPPTVEELIQKAQAAGDAPEIKKDEENDVTILDYSEIL